MTDCQKKIWLSPPDLDGSELALVSEAFAANWIAPAGPYLDRFERAVAQQAGVEHAVAVSSGTAALHLALRHLALRPGEEVLCPTLTFCASANPIFYEQARPVFIDCAADGNIDPNLIADELASSAERGALPRAVIAVDLFGQPADLDAIVDAADRYEIPVIEDAAEAMGATYRGRHVGSGAWSSFFSFNGNKIITTGGGGVLCSNDLELVDHTRKLATQARDPAPHYEHSEIGFNYRLSGVAAAIGIAQMRRLPALVERRRANRARYAERLAALPGVTFLPPSPFGESNGWLTVIRVAADRFGVGAEELRRRLAAANVEARPVWKPLHLQPAYRGCRRRGGDAAEAMFRHGLCLPSGSTMSPDDLDRVCGVIESTHQQSTHRAA